MPDDLKYCVEFQTLKNFKSGPDYSASVKSCALYSSKILKFIIENEL